MKDCLIYKCEVWLSGNPNKVRAVEERRDEAVSAFKVLGTNASAAFPALNVLFTNKEVVENQNALLSVTYSLAWIGGGAKDVFSCALTNSNRNLRAAALVGISALGAQAKDLMPLVLERCRDSDAEIRQYAIYFVARYFEPAESKRGFLRAASRDPDADVRRLANRELEKMEHAGEKGTP